jgi:hypothetical protein
MLFLVTSPRGVTLQNVQISTYQLTTPKAQYGKSDTFVEEEHFRFDSHFQEVIVISVYSASVNLLLV